MPVIPCRFTIALLFSALWAGAYPSVSGQSLPSLNPVAQEATERTLTIQEAIETSYRQNPIIEAQRLAGEAALFEKKSVWGLRLPRVSAAAAYTYMADDIKAFDLNPQKDKALDFIGQLELPYPIPPEVLQSIRGIDLSWTLQKQQFAVVGFTAVMPVYMGGKINAAVNVSKINIERSNVDAEKARIDLFAEVVERYYGLSLAQHVSEVRSEVAAGMQKHLHDAQKMEENGMIARTETLYAEMFFSKAQGEEQKARLQVGTVNKALATSLNQPGQYLPVTALFIVDSLKPLTHYQERTKLNSPLLKQVELTQRLAKEGVRAARSSLLPEVALMGAYDAWNYQLTDLAPKWAVGAAVKLRIFDGLGSEHKHTAAKRQVQQVEAMQVKAENDLMTLVEQLYNTIKASAAEVHALQSSVAFAESYLEAKEKAFAEGMAPSSEVVDAQLNLAAIRTERLTAAYAFDVALAQLLALSGETEEYTAFPYQPDYQIISTQ